jgi:hypothetical protein
MNKPLVDKNNGKPSDSTKCNKCMGFGFGELIFFLISAGIIMSSLEGLLAGLPIRSKIGWGF